MKNIFYVTLVFVLVNLSTVSANTFGEINPMNSSALISQIYNLLDEAYVPNEIRGQKAEVRLAVDTDNMVRILSVEADSDRLETYIRENIDFQKIRKGTFESGIVYRVPIEVAE